MIYRILCIHLGTPPQTLRLAVDRQGQRLPPRRHDDAAASSPRSTSTLPVDDYVCIVHDPRPTRPKGKTFTVEYLGNVVEGGIVKYLNVDIDLMKELAAKAIVGGEPVWFGCDTGKMSRRDLGYLGRQALRLRPLYDTTFDLDKADAPLLPRDADDARHAVHRRRHVDDKVPRRWRVENSWGERSRQEGLLTMNDNWFDEYVFEIAARRERPAARAAGRARRGADRAAGLGPDGRPRRLTGRPTVASRPEDVEGARPAPTSPLKPPDAAATPTKEKP